MPWCMQYNDGHFAQLKFLPVFGDNGIKRRGGFGPVNYGRARFFWQSHVAAYKIGMKMGLKDVFDLGSVFLALSI